MPQFHIQDAEFRAAALLESPGAMRRSVGLAQGAVRVGEGRGDEKGAADDVAQRDGEKVLEEESVPADGRAAHDCGRGDAVSREPAGAGVLYRARAWIVAGGWASPAEAAAEAAAEVAAQAAAQAAARAAAHCRGV